MLFGAASLALILLACAAAARTLGGVAERRLWLLMPLLLAHPAVVATLQVGNFHLAAVALCLLCWVALERRRDGLAGGLLAAATLAKIFPGLLGVVLLVQGRWRAVGFTALPGWPAGVYCQGGDVYRVRIVVASELPRDRSTLLVRLMAAGPGLVDALADLAALPDDAHERGVAEGIVVHLQSRLARKSSRTLEEEELIVIIQGGFKEARALGRDEGRALGRAEQAARAVLTVFHVRGVAVPDEARERILAEKDPSLLERWLERAVLAVSASEVIGEPT
jgi:hypothetical protein